MRLLLVISFLLARGWAAILQVQSMDEVMEHFKEGDSSTFAVFDIDMVLIQPDDPAFQMVNIEKYAPIVKRVIHSVPIEKRDILYTLTALDYESVLVDEKIPVYIQELSAKGIPTFALTASLTGSLLHVPSLENWKSEHLHQQGIFFEQGAPYFGSRVFSSLDAYRGNHPKFVQGVLFSNGGLCSKGKTLVAFLQDLHLDPDEVVFVDDKEDNLKSVEAALLAYNPAIKFTGLHFLGARHYPTVHMTEEEFTARWENVASQALALE